MKRFAMCGLTAVFMLLLAVVLGSCNFGVAEYPVGTEFVCDDPQISLKISQDNVPEGTFVIDGKEIPVCIYYRGRNYSYLAHLYFIASEEREEMLLSGEYIQDDECIILKYIEVLGEDLFPSLKKLEGKTIVLERVEKESQKVVFWE